MFYRKLLTFTLIPILLYFLSPYMKDIGAWIFTFIDFYRVEIFILFILLGIVLLISYILCPNYYSNNKKSSKISPDNEFEKYDSQKVTGVKNIIDSHNDNSFFSLALIGDWGSGKSSFLKKLKKEIELKDKDIVIYLNVWEIENIQNILQEIEKEFDNIVFKYDKIEWLIYHLKSILVKNYFSLLSKYFTEHNININPPFSNTLKDSKDEYNILLKRVLDEKKIVLMLDELDRLEAKEDVVDIFKVIRYLTSFDKIFTITGVDINKLPRGIELDYIHKIFNSKYIIPKPSKEELLDFLREERSDKLSIIGEKDFNDILNKLSSNNEKCLIEFISTYREIKNMCNDTYFMYTSLNNGIHNWNNLSKFIFIFNLIKATNIKLYTKFMNEEESIQLRIIDYFAEIKSKEENLEKHLYKDKIKEYLKCKDILSTFSFIIKKYDNLQELLHIYMHYNVADYMFTEINYKEFLKNPDLILRKLKRLKSNERLMNSEVSTKQDKFINFLITRLNREEDKSNIAKLLEKTFSFYSKEKLLNIFYTAVANFKEEKSSLITIEELFKLYLKKLTIPINNNIIYSFVNVSANNSNLYKKFYNLLVSPSNKTYFKTCFTQKQQNLYLRKEELFDFIKLINEYFEEDYNTFFEDEKMYSLYIQEDKYNPNFRTKREIKGKEVKEFIEKDDELQKLIKGYKDSKK
ncbi:P-loop NTPase fold protein [Aliarcobacter butzleri]|uniref:P-loop NTPase fold protein n=1 Tax=Aliarcobacter butzleri TaxID=28197 RepID=UPI003B20CB15